MSNALSIFENPKLQLPAHIEGFLGNEKNIEDRTTVPSLGIEGKVFTIAMNGEKRKLTRRDDEGDEVPIAVLRVVILDFAKRRGRAYYEGGYDPAKTSAPICWSEDGVRPHDKVEKKQWAVCDKCPMSAKGSRVSENGKSVSACSQHRMVAVVPSANLEHEPLRLKLAITSDWDKQNPELEAQGWFGFQNYTDFLRSKGITHTATVVTKMRFDPNTAYPKVIFSPDRFLEEAQLAVLAPVMKSDKVKDLLSATWTPAGVDGARTDEVEEFKNPLQAAAQATANKAADEITQKEADALIDALIDAKVKADEAKTLAAAKEKSAEATAKAVAAKEKADAARSKAQALADALDVEPPKKPKPTASAKAPMLDLGEDDEGVEIIPPAKNATAANAAKVVAAAAAATKQQVPELDDLLDVWSK